MAQKIQSDYLKRSRTEQLVRGSSSTISQKLKSKYEQSVSDVKNLQLQAQKELEKIQSDAQGKAQDLYSDYQNEFKAAVGEEQTKQMLAERGGAFLAEGKTGGAGSGGRLASSTISQTTNYNLATRPGSTTSNVPPGYVGIASLEGGGTLYLNTSTGQTWKSTDLFTPASPKDLGYTPIASKVGGGLIYASPFGQSFNPEKSVSASIPSAETKRSIGDYLNMPTVNIPKNAKEVLSLENEIKKKELKSGIGATSGSIAGAMAKTYFDAANKTTDTGKKNLYIEAGNKLVQTQDRLTKGYFEQQARLAGLSLAPKPVLEQARTASQLEKSTLRVFSEDFSGGYTIGSSLVPNVFVEGQPRPLIPGSDIVVGGVVGGLFGGFGALQQGIAQTTLLPSLIEAKFTGKEPREVLFEPAYQLFGGERVPVVDFSSSGFLRPGTKGEVASQIGFLGASILPVEALVPRLSWFGKVSKPKEFYIATPPTTITFSEAEVKGLRNIDFLAKFGEEKYSFGFEGTKVPRTTRLSEFLKNKPLTEVQLEELFNQKLPAALERKELKDFLTPQFSIERKPLTELERFFKDQRGEYYVNPRPRGRYNTGKKEVIFAEPNSRFESYKKYGKKSRKSFEYDSGYDAGYDLDFLGGSTDFFQGKGWTTEVSSGLKEAPTLSSFERAFGSIKPVFSTKNKLDIFEKSAISFSPNTKLGSLSIQGSSLKEASKAITGTATFAGTKAITGTTTIGATREVTRQATKQATMQKLQELFSSQTPKSVMKIIPREEIIGKIRPESPEIKFPKEKPPFIPKVLMFESKPSEEFGTGYFGEVKQRGKFVKINSKPTTKSKALLLALEAADNTPSRTVQLIKSKSPIRDKQEVSLPFELLGKFRVNKKGQYVEKNEFGIDTKGEFEKITVEGWKAKRAKRNKAFALLF